MDAERFVRQILVDGIGEAGQRAIAARRAAVGGEGFDHEVARLYACAAGFAGVEPCGEPLASVVEGGEVVHAAAREAVDGARAVVREIDRAAVAAREGRTS